MTGRGRNLARVERVIRFAAYGNATVRGTPRSTDLRRTNRRGLPNLPRGLYQRVSVIARTAAFVM